MNMEIQTDRLRLRSWRESDRNSFAALNADPVVMADLGGPLSRDLSDAKFDRYVEAYKENGFGRWLIETFAGRFLGYCGVMAVSKNHPLGPHHEIGWRLLHNVWGHGYATEAAHACLEDAFRRAQLQKVLAYTAPDNTRSQAVMPMFEFAAYRVAMGNGTQEIKEAANIIAPHNGEEGVAWVLERYVL